MKNCAIKNATWCPISGWFSYFFSSLIASWPSCKSLCNKLMAQSDKSPSTGGDGRPMLRKPFKKFFVSFHSNEGLSCTIPTSEIIRDHVLELQRRNFECMSMKPLRRALLCSSYEDSECIWNISNVTCLSSVSDSKFQKRMNQVAVH